MTRAYSAIAQNKLDRIEPLLNTLADKGTQASDYQTSLYQLGIELGDAVLAQIGNDSSGICLACTVEDADYFAKGILSHLESNGKAVAFTCLWNQRFSPFGVQDLTIAPIYREYREPSDRPIKYLIVAKTIISSGCVVRTNLLHLIEKLEPEKIFIVAPVIHSQSEERLQDEFEPETYNKFQFLYLAKDSDRTPSGEIVPGVGGLVYERLGIQDAITEKRYIPDIVKTRRSKIANV